MSNNLPRNAARATVIVSVYNNLRFLELVIAGLRIQTERDFEVIISDDGSGDIFVHGVESIIEQSGLSVRHNWHEDLGFRKNKILNSAVRKAQSGYLIFIDGDCIPHPRFVEEHLSNARPGQCLVGRRVDLSAAITARLSPEKIRAGYLQTLRAKVLMTAAYITGRLAHLKSGIYIKNRFLRKFYNRKDRGLLGANFSVHKSDLLAVNGFDERYTQPTFGEDSDIEMRLRLNGVSFHPVIGIAVMYHCHHKLLPRPEESKALYEKAVKEARAFTPYGIIRTED